MNSSKNNLPKHVDILAPIETTEVIRTPPGTFAPLGRVEILTPSAIPKVGNIADRIVPPAQKLDISLEQVAIVCHQGNIAAQIAAGETPSPRWVWMRPEIKESTREGIRNAMAGSTPEEMHASWSKNRLDAGWVYGEVKDEVAMTHPCLVPYSELPEEQRVKDFVMLDVVALFQKNFNIVE